MFWKFGFHDTSTLDALLDKEEVSLEAILDEEDLLQECKSQNTRLSDYFQRVDVLQRLFGYVTGTIEGEGQAKYKYPFITTEVLCSEIWSIVETCLNNADKLLTLFWDTVLDRDPDELKSQAVMASHFAKINATFLAKKPGEMLKFIQSQPNIIERLLNQLETPAIVDLLVRIIQLDEYAAGVGVLEWLSAERLIPRLVDLLSPFRTPSLHSVVSELIKGIISMSAPSPGAGITEGLQNGPASNLFARQLAEKGSIEKLAGFMLDDYSFEMGRNKDLQEADPVGASIASQDSSAIFRASSLPPLPNLDSITSSGTQSISIIVELIRKNNSDYFEPYLFHTIRNRLIQIQQHLHVQNDSSRDALEQAFNEMVERMGVVHLGPMLEIMCNRFERFQQLLHKPRSSEETILTTVGPLKPLTFERFRICELYAELLHCSNMSLLNRSPEYDDLYDSEGRLKGGLSALEELAKVIAIGNGSDEQGNMDADTDEMEPAQELPVSLASTDLSNLHYSDEDDDMSTGDDHSCGDVDGMEEIDMSDEANFASPPPISPREEEAEEMPPLIVPSSPNATSTSDYVTRDVVRARKPSIADSERSSVSRPASAGSRRSLKRFPTLETSYGMPVGEKLKRRFQETKVLSTLLDLFFAFPWNNFLHSVVYDVLHQILTGRVESGMNRELTITLFRDARLLYRIVKAQKENDAESAKPGHVRLGYMGHLTLISEDVIGALEHYPPDLRLLLARYAPQPDWDDYVGGRYHETKSRDTSLLGGGKPVVVSGMTRGATKWKVDEAEIGPVSSTVNGTSSSSGAPSELKKEFKGTARPMRGSSADFGVAAAVPDDDDDDDVNEIETSGPPQFASYLAQAMSTHISSSPDYNSDDDDEDDEVDGGWLSHKFELGNPPVSARNHSASRRPLNPEGFDNTSNPTNCSSSSADGNVFDDNFNLNDDRFGPFTDASAASASTPDGDPFSFTNVGDGVEDGSFDNFADFGDFQSGDGDLTPTGGSWTFASDASISSGSDDVEVIEADRLSDSTSPQDKRTDTHRS